MNLKKYAVRASAGESSPAADIHTDLQSYVDTLADSDPQYGFVTGVPQLDLSQLLQALEVKIGNSPAPATVAIDRAHHRLHEIDEDDPTIWSRFATALLYRVDVPDGAGGTEPQYLSISFED